MEILFRSAGNPINLNTKVVRFQKDINIQLCPVIYIWTFYLTAPYLSLVHVGLPENRLFRHRFIISSFHEEPLNEYKEAAFPGVFHSF